MKKFNAMLKFLSNYRILGENEMATGWLLRAWEDQPNRAEPLYQIANLHRHIGNNRLALLFALQGQSIPKPKTDALYVNDRVYQYLLDEEISIVAFYVQGMRKYGREAIVKLLSIKDKITKDSYELASRNAGSYGIDLNSTETNGHNDSETSSTEKDVNIQKQQKCVKVGGRRRKHAKKTRAIKNR